VPFQKGLLVDTWWDLGLGEEDSTAIWFTQDVGREIHVIDYYEDTNKGFDWYVKEVLHAWSQDKGYVYGTHGAPHDIRRREMFNKAKSRLQVAREMGINFKIAPKIPKADGIAQVRKIFGLCWFDEQRCTKEFAKNRVGLPSLESYRREWDEHMGTYRQHPLHNWASHGADAFRTMATLHKFKTAAEAWAASNRQDVARARVNIDRKDPRGWT